MENNKNIDEYIQIKKDKIIKLTNNKINSFLNNINCVFDDMIFSKSFGILDNNNKKILMGKYEILGYYNKYQKKWLWAYENKLTEKYLTIISKKIKNIVNENNKTLGNFDYNKIDDLELNKLLNICLYYSDKIWICSRNINFDNNLYEFIIITDINQLN